MIKENPPGIPEKSLKNDEELRQIVNIFMDS